MSAPRTTPEASTDRREVARGLAWLTGAGLVGLLLRYLADGTVLDADTFHAMALVRHALATGAFPRHDVFAYTPTLPVVVHHEWGAGAVLYAAWRAFGWAGPSALRYALVAGILWASVATARRRGATVPAIAATAPLAILLLTLGLAPVRAQIFTFLLFAVLLLFLEADRRGARAWMAPWLALHVAWVNLHGGFVVGLGTVALALAERWAREGWRAARHLAALLVAMAALVLVNPYGPAYVPYLGRALAMRRPLMDEWAPIWDARADLGTAAAFALSLLVLAYALRLAGIRRAPGLALVAVTAVAAARAQRHLPLYAIAWFATVAPLLPGTELGRMVQGWYARRRSAVAAVALLGAAVGAWRTYEARAWRLTTPSDPGASWRAYPVGAVDHLAAAGFSGNVLTEFEIGSYVSWRLHPAVKVSLDTRYEAAFQQGVLEDHVSLLRAEPGWRAVLARYPPDAILLRRSAPVAPLLAQEPGWAVEYGDRRWMLLVRRAGVVTAP